MKKNDGTYPLVLLNTDLWRTMSLLYHVCAFHAADDVIEVYVMYI